MIIICKTESSKKVVKIIRRSISFGDKVVQPLGGFVSVKSEEVQDKNRDHVFISLS